MEGHPPGKRVCANAWRLGGLGDYSRAVRSPWQALDRFEDGILAAGGKDGWERERLDSEHQLGGFLDNISEAC